RYIQDVEELRIPLALVYVQHQGTRRVRRVGGMNLALRQIPDKPRIDGAEREVTLLGERPRAVDVVQDPLNLGPREVGVEQEARSPGKHWLESVVLQRLAGVGRAPVLPYDGAMNGATVAAI